MNQPRYQIHEIQTYSLFGYKTHPYFIWDNNKNSWVEETGQDFLGYASLNAAKKRIKQLLNSTQLPTHKRQVVAKNLRE